jgi:DNA-binding transcriptional ArsR family regulator
VVTTLDQTFGALADPTRLAVTRLLLEAPRSSGEIAAALSTTRPAMSRHLRVLRRAGLVEERADPDDARLRVYRLRPAPFEDLRAWLDEVEAFWQQQLAAFRDYAESSPRGPSAGPKGKAR